MTFGPAGGSRLDLASFLMSIKLGRVRNLIVVTPFGLQLHSMDVVVGLVSGLSASVTTM